MDVGTSTQIPPPVLASADVHPRDGSASDEEPACLLGRRDAPCRCDLPALVHRLIDEKLQALRDAEAKLWLDALGEAPTIQGDQLETNRTISARTVDHFLKLPKTHGGQASRRVSR